ncbi:ras association domain-containing protein 1-like isoform X1 [Lethenteron reissneri]|uniref:ras association domain-containing protein 1-like isoform X1 n=1 Tax=Lethenteron reissneri TaxID=7753 RepID=UPI002AB7C541|nr:ras association domain-containing protein 1-like isoform X1 [Lethenteron reissneri]
MSSGYSSLDDDVEMEQFFTAKPTFIQRARNRFILEKQDSKKAIEEVSEKPSTCGVDLKAKISEFNSQVDNGMVITLQADDSYTGFIRVHMSLSRPISVESGKRPPSIYDALRSGATAAAGAAASASSSSSLSVSGGLRRRTSFYLPHDAVKQLHVSSGTTAREVIEALLRKFMVLDSPRKFAVFQRCESNGQVTLRKMADTEHPLYLRLMSGPDCDAMRFLLKENFSEDVEWDAFSLPELHNFLRILDKEERKHAEVVNRNYARYRDRLRTALVDKLPT